MIIFSKSGYFYLFCDQVIMFHVLYGYVIKDQGPSLKFFLHVSRQTRYVQLHSVPGTIYYDTGLLYHS